MSCRRPLTDKREIQTDREGEKEREREGEGSERAERKPSLNRLTAQRQKRLEKCQINVNSQAAHSFRKTQRKRYIQDIHKKRSKGEKGRGSRRGTEREAIKAQHKQIEIQIRSSKFKFKFKYKFDNQIRQIKMQFNLLWPRNMLQMLTDPLFNSPLPLPACFLSSFSLS